ncbi:MAG: DUF501 domain-containing protein [Promicromonosporaceae bacterium]|nr:DUF501 domain-containing protein [Promicromonosporaceae bacterium]
MDGQLTEADLARVAEQLGRVPRGVVDIAARCHCGAPLVVTTAPRLPDGTPFPTMYYLTDPGLTAAISRLEADGEMVKWSERLDSEPEFAAHYQDAHRAYLANRDQLAVKLGEDVPEIAGISAGGMPTRVKCLHALVGHALAAGPGVNPVGDAVLAQLGWQQATCREGH